jgi:hypothetical protein
VWKRADYELQGSNRNDRLFGRVHVSRKLARRFRSVQAIFSARKKAHKTLNLECLSMTYGVVRAIQVIVNTLLCSPEKAGVGGSTPSLATIIPPSIHAGF